ncbi:MAG: DUF72 domain-containing protein [Planctomycetes bacterium]|nr:DUF72 domain-containing protein [Planctomycetota bacterium]
MTPAIVGASGYSYKDWVGPFYPEETRPGGMLAYYAARFDAVELNYTYYRMPDAETLVKLAREAAAVNPRFLFAVKAHRTLTHEISANWQAGADAFKDALAGLRTNGADRLVAVLVQFPFSCHYTIQNRRHLAALLKRWSGLPVAVEFRNVEWLKGRVMDELRARDVALVGVDEPDLEGLFPRRVWPGWRLGYVRFPGRTRDNWWRGDNASRYDYEYSEAELREWLPRLTELMAFSRRTVAFFNNHWQGKATRNADMLRQLLMEGKSHETPHGHADGTHDRTCVFSLVSTDFTAKRRTP